MKFGVREICDVVLKAKANGQTVGNKTYNEGQPVLYFDTLKTSSMEGAATTVYAQGGKGNSRLVAWEGERTVTFTMEDALISPLGFMMLSGAGLVDAAEKDNGIQVHVTEKAKIYTSSVKYKKAIEQDPGSSGGEESYIQSSYAAYIITNEPLSNHSNADIYVMGMKDSEIVTEPFIGKKVDTEATLGTELTITISNPGKGAKGPIKYDNGTETISGISSEEFNRLKTEGKLIKVSVESEKYEPTDLPNALIDKEIAMIDYYTDKKSKTSQIEITPDKFGGNYYLEASTLFRTEKGVDLPAEFIIPNCKIQSNFNFTMASSGDPSTFTFTMDAFPDYTRFDNTKKVLAAIQIRNNKLN